MNKAFVRRLGRIGRITTVLALAVPAVFVATGATAGAARSSSGSFSKTLVDVVAPGTLATVHWTVPAADNFELGAFSISTATSGTTGQLHVQLIKPGVAMPQDLIVVGLGEVH